MTTKFEDDTTGEQYTRREIKSEGIIGGSLYDPIDYHPEHADYDELRRRLHKMVDAAVDAFEEGGE